MILEGAINNVYFFGTLKNGFSSFPQTKMFDQFYDNTIKDGWVQTVRKIKDNVYLTYIQYGFLTAEINGRTGSCFGISVEFNNTYFNDFNYFRTELIHELINHFFEEETLIKKDKFHNSVFVTKEFSQIAEYLNLWSSNIKNVLKNDFKKNIISLEKDIPDYSKKIKGVHPDSDVEIIQNIFKETGSINISPRFPIITKEDIAIKEQENSYLTIIAELKKEKSELKASIINYRENYEEEKSKRISLENKIQLANKNKEVDKIEPLFNKNKPLNPQNKLTSFFALVREIFKPKKRKKLKYKPDYRQYKSQIMIILAFIVLGYITYKFSSEKTTTTPKTEKQEPNSSSDTNEHISHHYLFYKDDVYYLNTESFLKKMVEKRKEVSSIEGFKTDLAEHLWSIDNFPKLFNSKKESFKVFITSKNPEVLTQIKDHISRNKNLPYNSTNNWSKTIDGCIYDKDNEIYKSCKMFKVFIKIKD